MALSGGVVLLLIWVNLCPILAKPVHILNINPPTYVRYIHCSFRTLRCMKMAPPEGLLEVVNLGFVQHYGLRDIVDFLLLGLD